MNTVTKCLALMGAVALLAGCIVIPVERHTSETHHHYYGQDETHHVAETPATQPSRDHDHDHDDDDD